MRISPIYPERAAVEVSRGYEATTLADDALGRFSLGAIKARANAIRAALSGEDVVTVDLSHNQLSRGVVRLQREEAFIASYGSQHPDSPAPEKLVRLQNMHNTINIFLARQTQIVEVPSI